MSKEPIQITIDGPSASGKSTVAKSVAKRLGFFHIDTGAIYRAIALWCYEKKIDSTNVEVLERELKGFSFSIRHEEDGAHYYVGDREVTKDIRKEPISKLASQIAAIPIVRKCSTGIQRKLASKQNVVVEGRDAGSVVFPKAPYKFYVTASLKERARRRLKELKAKKGDENLTTEVMLKEIEERDERDTKRKDSPLVRPIDSECIDTTCMTEPEVVRSVVKKVRKKRRRAWFSWLWAPFVGKEVARCSFVYKSVYLLTKVIYKLFYRLEVRGLENYPKGSAIIAPNHVSFLDPPAVGCACPQEVYAMGQDYLFRIPLVGSIIKRLNTLPVTNTASDKGVIKQVISLLLQNQQVIIFPEGSRSFTGEILPLKKGVGMIVSKTGCRVVPAYLDGIYEIWPRGKKFPRPFGKITLTFGKPLIWQNYESKYTSKKEASEALLEDLAETLKRMKREADRKKKSPKTAPDDAH